MAKHTRIIGLYYLLLCSLVAIYNFDIALVLALIGSFFLINKFGIYEYIFLSVMLLIKSQSSIVLSSQDLLGYAQTYTMIGHGLNPYSKYVFSKGEVLLQSFFWLFSRFLDTATISWMSLSFVTVFLIFLYPIVKRFNNIPIVAVSLVLFIDVNFVVHLFRQSIASLILIWALLFLFSRRKKYKGVLLYFLAGLTHSVSYLFGILGILFERIPLKYMKILLLISLIMGIFVLQEQNFHKLLVLVSGVDILDKASYALNVFGRGHGGIRYIAILAAVISFLVSSSHPLFRIYIGFTALGLFFYHVPIVGPRVGLIGTSILTGLPIGLFINDFKKKFITFISNTLDEKS